MNPIFHIDISNITIHIHLDDDSWDYEIHPEADIRPAPIIRLQRDNDYAADDNDCSE